MEKDVKCKRCGAIRSIYMMEPIDDGEYRCTDITLCWLGVKIPIHPLLEKK